MRNMIYSQERILILNTGLPDFLEDKNMKETEGKVELCVSGEKSDLKNCYSEPQRNIMNQSGIKLLDRKKNKDSTRDVVETSRARREVRIKFCLKMRQEKEGKKNPTRLCEFVIPTL